jgi:hypothetical protein
VHAALALIIDGGRIAHLDLLSLLGYQPNGPDLFGDQHAAIGQEGQPPGQFKVATVVMVKGRLASGFCSPILTWAQAATDTRVKSNAAFANFIVILSLLLKRPALSDPGRFVNRTLPLGRAE